MKKSRLVFNLTITFFAMFPFCLHAQNEQLQQAPGWYSSAGADGGSRNVVWSEAFADGIPANWSNEELGGIAAWEYRGIQTIPSNEIGTRGSCIPANAEGGPPIQSPTWENGFVLFDSNYWDNSENPCSDEFFGSGQAPGPHLATLTTPSIDLSSVANSALRFNQFTKFYQGVTRVEMRTGDSDWTVIYSPIYSIGFSTSTSDQITVPLGPSAAFASDIQLRFVYDGLYYFWQIDDIEIIETFENDIRVSDFNYGAFNPQELGNFSNLEYSQYPDFMPPLVHFTASGINSGATVQTNCQLTAELTRLEDAELIHMAFSQEGADAEPGATFTVNADPFQSPASLGKYQITYTLTQNETDQNTADNSDSTFYYISTSTLSRDRIFATSVYQPSAYLDSTYRLGNILAVTESGTTPQSISIAVGAGTSNSARVFGAIYSFNINDFNETTLIASTDTVTVDSNLFNTTGDQLLLTLDLTTQPVLSQGQAYLVMAGTPDTPQDIRFAMSGASPAITSWVIFGSSTYFYLTQLPMVRMNFGPLVNVTETSASHLHAFPNPASEYVWIESDQILQSNEPLAIHDLSGRLVANLQPMRYGDHHYFISLAGLSSGTYFIHMPENETLGSIKLIVK